MVGAAGPCVGDCPQHFVSVTLVYGGGTVSTRHTAGAVPGEVTRQASHEIALRHPAPVFVKQTVGQIDAQPPSRTMGWQWCGRSAVRQRRGGPGLGESSLRCIFGVLMSPAAVFPCMSSAFALSFQR